MYSLYFGLVVHLLLVASSYSLESKNEKDEKMLIMLEYEPIKSDDRSKRSSTGEAVRQERQSAEVPQEYLGLLQQLVAQQHQQQTSASAQQPQQHLIQQLVVSRDGSRQPTAARYVLTQDGRLIDEGSFAALSQQQQQHQALSQPQQLTQSLGQNQAFGLPIYQQSPLQSTQPQQIPPAPVQPVRPGQRPQISEFARQQQRVLQEVRDAPIRAQIAGFTIRPPNNPVQALPTGPNSQSPQVFAQAGQQQQQQPQLGASPQFHDPENPNIVYTAIPVDPQAYQLHLQQQLGPQLGAEVDPRQIYAQFQRPSALSQQIIYQQPIRQEITQDKIRRPINVVPSPSSSEPQVVPQNLPQQYLIETTNNAKPQHLQAAPQPQQQPQYISSDAAVQIQYVQQPAQQQPTPIRQPEAVQQSTLLQPVAGRGLFTPVKPSRSSIFVSRSSAPKPVSLTVSDEITSEKVPVIRLPSPSGQRPLTKQELDLLVNAGFSVTPVQGPQQIQYLKSKRQPAPEERRNHVVYENPQDGVQYHYSPGSSDPTSTIKTKKSVHNNEYIKLIETEKQNES